jgi:riboflavin synthase
MFTGIVEELGRCDSVERRASTTRLWFSAPLVSSSSQIGESIAVNGCCLTVVELAGPSWAADAVDETLSRTNLSTLTPGERVNLERPVALGGRLGGHLVQGHVDGVGTVLEAAPHLRVTLDPGLERYVVEKGSITVDGCSLTVVGAGASSFSCELIPHTISVTTLGFKGAGSLVNLEVDVVAKYVERLVVADTPTPYDRERN